MLIKSYAEKGFFQIAKKGKNVKYVARRVDKWIFLSGDFEVVKKFNSVMRGIANYYCGIDCPSALYELWELFRRSLALSLAHRHKKRSAKSSFQKWGKDLIIKYEVKKKDQKETKEIKFEIPDITYGKFKPSGAKEGQFVWLNSFTIPKGRSFSKSLSSMVKASELSCSIPS